jgi:hypothetical protein
MLCSSMRTSASRMACRHVTAVGEALLPDALSTNRPRFEPTCLNQAAQEGIWLKTVNLLGRCCLAMDLASRIRPRCLIQ